MPTYKNTTRVPLVHPGDGPKDPGWELGYLDTIEADANPYPAVLKEVQPDPTPEPGEVADDPDASEQPGEPEPSSAAEEGHQP